MRRHMNEFKFDILNWYPWRERSLVKDTLIPVPLTNNMFSLNHQLIFVWFLFDLGRKTTFPGRRWTNLRGWIRRRLASRGLPLRGHPWGWRRRFRQGHNWGEVDHWRVEKERWSPPTRILRSAKILADNCTSDRAWTTTRWQHGQCTRGRLN